MGVAPEEGIEPCRIGVDRQREDIVARIEDALRAVAMMQIDIDDRDPVVGLAQVLRGLERQSDGSWAEGKIIRPIEDEVYRTEIRVAGDDTLKVEGCAMLGLVCSTPWRPMGPRCVPALVGKPR